MHKYYTTMRPPMIGCVPKGAAEIECFDERCFVTNIGHEAWGYACYKEKLTQEQIDEYELVEDAE